MHVFGCPSLELPRGLNETCGRHAELTSSTLVCVAGIYMHDIAFVAEASILFPRRPVVLPFDGPCGAGDTRANVRAVHQSHSTAGISCFGTTAAHIFIPRGACHRGHMLVVDRGDSRRFLPRPASGWTRWSCSGFPGRVVLGYKPGRVFAGRGGRPPLCRRWASAVVVVPPAVLLVTGGVTTNRGFGDGGGGRLELTRQRSPKASEVQNGEGYDQVDSNPCANVFVARSTTALMPSVVTTPRNMRARVISCRALAASVVLVGGGAVVSSVGSSSYSASKSAGDPVSELYAGTHSSSVGFTPMVCYRVIATAEPLFC